MRKDFKTVSVISKLSIVLTGLLFATGCQNVFDFEDPYACEDNSPLGQAKSWYQEIKKSEEVLLSTPGTRSGEPKLFYTEPSWKYYCVTQEGDYTAVEVDLTDRIGLDFVTEEKSNTYEETGEQKYRRSYTRLVILIHNTTQEKTGFLMTLVPSVWTSRHFSKSVTKTTYFNRDKFYVGLVIFHDLDGNFVNGWSYREGKLYAKILHGEDYHGEGIKYAICPASYAVVTKIKTRNGWEDDDLIDRGFLIESECIGTYPPPPTYPDIPSFPDYWYEDPWYDPWDTGGYTGGGGGSNGGSNNSNTGGQEGQTTPAPPLDKIAKKNSLTPGDTQKLVDALEKMRQECAFQQILNYLQSCGFKLEDILVDPTLEGNAAFTSANRLKFIDSDQISAERLIHELTHAYQHTYHKRKGNGYEVGGRETGALEFEVYLLADLIAYRKDPNIRRSEWACREYGKGYYKIEENYEQWLQSLLGPGNTFPTSIDMEKFHEFDNLFRESHTFYRKYEYNVEYLPSIPDLFKIVNEKCN